MADPRNTVPDDDDTSPYGVQPLEDAKRKASEYVQTLIKNANELAQEQIKADEEHLAWLKKKNNDEDKIEKEKQGRSQTWQQSMRQMGETLRQFSTTALLSTAALQQFIGAVQSGISTYVAAFNPAAVQVFSIVIRDLNGTIGEILVPVLAKFRELIRGIADVIAGASPQAKLFIGALIGTGVAMATAAALATALGTTISFATGGLSGITAAIAGMAGAVAGLGSFAVFTADLTKFKDALRPLMVMLESALTSVGQAFMSVLQAMQPLVGVLTGMLSSGIGNAVSMFKAFIDVLVPIINTVVTLLPPILTLGQALASLNVMVVQFVVAALQPFLGIIQILAAGIQLLLTPFTLMMRLFDGLFAVFGKIFGIVGQIISLPFSIVANAIQAVTDAISGAAGGPLGEMIAEFKLLFSELESGMRQLGPIIKDVVGVAVRGMIGSMAMLARVIGAVTGPVTRFISVLRSFLGLQESDPSGKSEGKGIRDAKFSSMDEVIREAQKNAFAMGKGDPPEVKTANVLERIEKQLQKFFPDKNLDQILIDIVDSLSGRAGTLLGSATGIVMSGINPVAAAITALVNIFRTGTVLGI